MRSPIVCIFLILLLCLATSVKVRITDRKPKWAVVKPNPPSPPSPPPLPKEQVIQPVEDSQEEETQEEQGNELQTIDYNSINRKRAPLDFTGPSALSHLQNICSDYNDGHYVYHVCPFQSIYQIENQGNGYKGCIGIWGKYTESPYQKNEVHLLFTNGESCPGAIDRETELTISCDPEAGSLQIHSVNEREVCHYTIEGSSSLVCAINPEEMPDKDIPPQHETNEEEMSVPPQHPKASLQHTAQRELEVTPEGSSIQSESIDDQIIEKYRKEIVELQHELQRLQDLLANINR